MPTFAKRGRQIEAVLTRCRVDAGAAEAHYDDSQGFVVYAVGGAVKQVRYVFKNLEEAYATVSNGRSVRRFKWFD